MKRIKEHKLMLAMGLLWIVQATIVMLTFSNIMNSSLFLDAINGLNVKLNMNVLMLLLIVFSVILILLVVGYDCIFLIIVNRHVFKTKIKLSDTAMLVILSNIIALIMGTIITSAIGFSFSTVAFLLSPGTIVKLFMFYFYGIYIQKMWNNKVKVVFLCCVYYCVSLALASLMLYRFK